MFLLATQCWFQSLVLLYVVQEGGKKRPNPSKCSDFQARKFYLRSCLTSHPQRAWGCDGDCFWRERWLPRELLVIVFLCKKECLVPLGTGEDMGQHRGEKRTDRCHQALLERWATFASPNASHLPWSMTNSYQFLLYCFFQPTGFIHFSWWIYTYETG